MATKITPAPLTRPLWDIAMEIGRDYRKQGKPIYFAAEPYVRAMAGLHDFEDNFGHDSAVDIVRYAVSNLGAWRGETATRVKAELKAALADHDSKKRRTR